MPLHFFHLCLSPALFWTSLFLFSLFFTGGTVVAQSQNPQGDQHTHRSQVPKASKKDHLMTVHGDTRNDPYYWMRLTDEQKSAKTPDDRTQKVLDYIQQEMQY